jgi:hypothetical protein
MQHSLGKAYDLDLDYQRHRNGRASPEGVCGFEDALGDGVVGRKGEVRPANDLALSHDSLRQYFNITNAWCRDVDFRLISRETELL